MKAKSPLGGTRSSGKWVAAVLRWGLAGLLFARAGALAVDAPHSALCADCHINHDQFGQQFESTAGNANVCWSCHVPGGTASRKALVQSDQAVPGSGTGLNAIGQGTSHRWDSGASGRVTPLGDSPRGVIAPSGVFTGRYAQSYTITITTGGDISMARFSWVADAPYSGSGTNVPLQSRVIVDIDDEGYATYETIPGVLEKGISLTFYGTPTFRAGDSWRFYVRPDITAPANADMLWCMTGDTVSCSVCHDQHSQALEPFDPSAPATGAGRHFMRAVNVTDQMCAECHGARFVTNAIAGSHPVGIFVPTNTAYAPPGSLPLDKVNGQMWCSTCHQPHNSASTDGNLLRASNEQQLCSQCHKQVNVAGPARHLAPLDGTLWPGGQYGSLRAADVDPDHRGSCGNCHQVHGWPDPSGTNDFAHLLVDKEENLCFTCHDGSPVGKNLKSEFTKTYNHPVALTGKHSTTEDGKPASYGTSNRHAECADCHNVHVLTSDAATPAQAPAASLNLAGVPRVAVTNISPGVVGYQYVSASDPTPAKEYEVCFTCHSGWTTQPSGQSNFAAEFNVLNASFHPVEGPGNNSNINSNSFVNGWNATSLMTCSDCHASDNTAFRGPHASTNQFIVKKRTVASTTRRPSGSTMASTELCFECHLFDTYANSGSSSTVRNYSRFSGSNGHAYHVVSQRYSCYNCHETHGTATQPNLLVTGRSPGINTYTRTASGGSCSPSCHGSESYSVTYPR